MSANRWMAFVWIFFLFLIQNAWNAFFFQNASSFLVAGVVCYALAEGPLFGLILGAWAGALLELFGTGPLGVQMTAMGLGGILVGLVSSKIFKDSLPAQLALPALCGFLTALLSLIALHARLSEPVGLGLFKSAFFWSHPFLTALASPFIFRLLNSERRPRRAPLFFR